ncbi:hypothetical protein PVAG01_05079 [Phlyctema vagabunda]|uniref:PH domain-containing protein n=1 Tax=Phlyctema vagabunda TaxID=108571 RepID=A0ABR4PJ21_9HELO
MSSEGDSASSATQAKFSRYRSVRQGSRQHPPTSMPEMQNQDGQISRSMSRYRRARPISKPDHHAQPVPPTPQIPQTLDQLQTLKARRVTTPVGGGPHIRPPPQRQYSADAPRESEGDRRKRQALEALAREEQAYRLRKEREERDRILKQQRAEQEAYEAAQYEISEEEAQRMLAETKRKDLERLEAELEAAPTSRVVAPKEKFGFFSRKKMAPQQLHQPVHIVPSQAPESSGILGVGPLKNHDGPARAIEQGGGGIVPGVDAPKSAVNSGDRTVTIRYNQSSIALPVNPETTPNDLVYTAASILSGNINPSTAVLSESYSKLGLERRIRRYEHVRDVMNSWDRDTQNYLLLQNSDSPAHDRNTLEAASIPREAPGDFRAVLYHSQKPGKWNKRCITLLKSGQVFMSKRLNALPGEKDVENLCHISDFDIYTPTRLQIRKHIEPPRKYCYAIKSQQKTTVFMNTENFVHFFCTNHEEVAEEWFAAVQSWRSWYLVNRMGEGKRKSQVVVPPTHVTPGIQIRPATKASSGRSRTPSADETPHTVGSFVPVTDKDNLNSFQEAEFDSEEENRPLQIPFHLRHASPVPRLEDRRHPPIVSYRVPEPAASEGECEFAAGGLLGRTYTQRQKAQKHKEDIFPPMGEGADPINGIGPVVSRQRTHSIPSQKRPDTAGRPVTSGGLQRNSSKREKPTPLLDFTPTFVEPPQWNKAGKGHGVSAPAGAPLVEAATTPETGFEELPGRSITTNNGLQRNGTRREKPAPLLDFTPTFVEPPQWSKVGKGHGVAAPNGVPLVDVATTPETGLDDIPKTATFRRENSVRPSTARPHTAGGRPPTGHKDRDGGAFVKGGLVEKMNAGNSR